MYIWRKIMTSFHIYIPANLYYDIDYFSCIYVTLVGSLLSDRREKHDFGSESYHSGLRNLQPDQIHICSKKSGSGPKSRNPYLIWGTANAKSVLITKCYNSSKCYATSTPFPSYLPIALVEPRSFLRRKWRFCGP